VTENIAATVVTDEVEAEFVELSRPERRETPEERAARKARQSDCYNSALIALTKAETYANSVDDWCKVAEGWRDLSYAG